MPTQQNLSHHPCFNSKARSLHARIHLPVAPRCNVQCNFCDRKYCCVNESRPGVSAAILSPAKALLYLDEAVERTPNLAVVGIAGPGDPFANADVTIETLSLVRQHYPHLLLCVSSNGLELAPYANTLAKIGVSHVTITINGINADIVAKIYAWVCIDGKRVFGHDAAGWLIERQQRAVDALVAAGVIVKINSVIIPGVNDEHIPMIAGFMASRGVDIHNCIPLIPTAGTLFGNIAEPDATLIHHVRTKAGAFLQQMNHCSRCRADACGLIGEKSPDPSQFDLLQQMSKQAKEAIYA